jgi:N-methylhydantoinase B/oxoprolinase/acetone carboxylase alpha subunit
MHVGDVFVIETPGGGGFGTPTNPNAPNAPDQGTDKKGRS